MSWLLENYQESALLRPRDYETTRPHLNFSKGTHMNTSKEQLQVPLVTINKLAEMTGYSAGALRKKIERGVLVEGMHYVRSPDSRILISLRAFQAWALGVSTEPLSKIAKEVRHA